MNTTDVVPITLPTVPKPQYVPNIYKLIFAMRRAANDIKYGFDETLKYEISPFPKSDQSIQFMQQKRIMAKVHKTLPEFLKYADKIGYELAKEIREIREHFKKNEVTVIGE